MAVIQPERPSSTRQDTPGLGPGPDREGLRVKLDPIPGLTPRRLMPRDGFYFQCPPLEEFAVDHSHTHSDYDTIKKGQFSRKGGRQLRSVTFDTLVVDWGRFTVVTKDILIEEFTERLIQICHSGDPFLLTVAHQMPPRGYDDWGATLAGPELQMEATLRTLRVAEKAGEGDARYLNVAFTEYREPFSKRRALGHGSGGGKKTPATVLLKRDGRAEDHATGIEIGDPPMDPLTLARLAKFYYGNPTKWRQIAQHPKNRIKNWGSNDSLLIFFTDRKNTRKWPVKITVPADENADAISGPGGPGGHGSGSSDG